MSHRLVSFASSIALSLGFGLALVAGPITSAAAQPAAATTAAASAEVQAAKGVDKRQPVEPGTTFAAGTKVWVWSRIAGANGTTVKHVWKKDGKPVWTAYLKVGSVKWTTSSRHQVKAGAWTVDVVGADGAVLGSVDFTAS